MIIQPRGFKRDSLYSSAAIEVKRRIELIAARFNCSKSFVVNTILCEALNIKGQPNYETYKPQSQKSINHSRSTNKVTKFEQRKKRAS